MVLSIINSKYFNSVLFTAYILLALIIYYSTDGAGMIFDFNGWTLKYEAGSWKDVLTCFGYPGLHQMEHFFFYGIYSIFGFNTTAWYVIFAILHGINSFLAYRFIQRWINSCHFKHFKQIAIVSSLLFLISPMAADTVGNKVTIHYLMSFIYLMSSLYLLIQFHQTKRWKHIGFVGVLFTLALFSLEISYTFPILYLIVWISLVYFNNEPIFTKKNILIISIPFALLISFLVLHKLVIGSMIGHYGSNVHLRFPIEELFSNVVRYFACYYVLFDYWDYKYKEFASHTLLTIAIPSLIVCIISGFSLFAFALKKKQNQLLLIIGIFLLGLFALAPVSNLYLVYMFPIENDRYGYIASIFIYFLIVFIVFQIPKRKIVYPILGLFILVNSFFLSHNISKLSQSGDLAWSLLNDFRWFEEEVIVLNDPDTFGGASMFRVHGDTSSFAESLFLHTNIDRRTNIHTVYQMNYCLLSDSVKVIPKGNHHYRIELAQWGNWYWKDMIGASPFEDQYFIANPDMDSVIYYDLYIKEAYQDATIVYAVGDKWKELN